MSTEYQAFKRASQQHRLSAVSAVEKFVFVHTKSQYERASQLSHSQLFSSFSETRTSDFYGALSRSRSGGKS